MNIVTLMSAALLSLAVAGCASTSIAPERFSKPNAQVAAAKEAGAEENPEAALHLKLANDAIARAKSQARDGEGHRANFTLDRATADAELALELARLEHTRAGADEAMYSIDALRRQNQQLKAD
jgi:hypothetical protein